MTSLGLQARMSNCPGVSRILQGLVLDAPSIGKSPPPCTLTCIIHWLLSPALSRPQKRWLLLTIDFPEPHHRWPQKRKRIWILRVPVVFGRWLCLPTFWRADPEKQGTHLNTSGEGTYISVIQGEVNSQKERCWQNRKGGTNYSKLSIINSMSIIYNMIITK